MTGAAQAPTKMEIGLVLQGGGALGVNVSLTADAVTDDANSFRDFSREGILARRDAGRRIALSALRETFHSQLAA